MVNIILFLWLTFTAHPNVFYLSHSQIGKRVIVVGEGVTGTWAAAKIAENLTSNDELIILSPPTKDIVKDLGNGVFSNDMTSAFTPIGIQIETGAINIEPPSQEDIKKAQAANQLTPELKLYISPHLDAETNDKLEYYLNRDKHKDISSIILRYHREICLPEWEKYIKEGGAGADIVGLYILHSDAKVLEKMKDKVIKNRIHSGYPADEKKLNVLAPEKMMGILSHYSEIIKTKKLNGLVGLDYDGRVKSHAVMETLNKKIKNANPKLVKTHAWVERLQTNKDAKGNLIVTGVILQNNQTLNSDVVVLALGHGVEKVLQNSNVHFNVPILNKWGVVYSISRDHGVELKEQPTIIMAGLGIVRDMPDMPMTMALGEWFLAKGEQPDSQKVVDFVKKSIRVWDQEFNTKKWEKTPLPIYVQPRPMTLDGLPVLDSQIKGLIILNPSGSQGMLCCVFQ